MIPGRCRFEVDIRGKTLAALEEALDQVKAIAEGKMSDLNCFTIASAMRMVAGTARSMGITVSGEFPKDL